MSHHFRPQASEARIAVEAQTRTSIWCIGLGSSMMICFTCSGFTITGTYSDPTSSSLHPVEADQAAVEQAELNLGYTRVVSLINGIAGINTVQVGNLVGPSTVLTAVSQVSPIKVYFPISEQEYLRMADGGAPGSVDWLTHASQIPLHLTLADGSAYLHAGKIIFADRQVDTQTGTIQIVGEFPNSRNLLRPGQYARVQASTGSIMGALQVPQSAVNQQQGTYQVTVLGADNRAEFRTVEVGPRIGALWVITSGLKPGERVVAVGADKAKEGEVVNPTPHKETEER
jgi:membrane fusion protein, multidrug efflux system